ncbi:MAG TPA: Hsp20/alpha crystallin family protein [Gaiellales bacterium]
MTTWDPFKEMERFESELGKLFTRPATSTGTWMPAVDVEQTPTEIVLTFDLPGMSPDDVKIELHDRTLTISGSREEKREEKHEGYHTRERVFGHFGRSFTLPYTVKSDEIEAVFAKGELHVHVPRPVEAQPQRIEIAAKE